MVTTDRKLETDARAPSRRNALKAVINWAAQLSIGRREAQAFLTLITAQQQPRKHGRITEAAAKDVYGGVVRLHVLAHGGSRLIDATCYLAKQELPFRGHDEQITSTNRAQTYDGAAVMSGQHNGLQALVRLKCKNAMFVHCYAHKLNLILKQSVDHIKECKVFFLTLSGLSSFFSKSTKRIYALEQEVKKRFPSVAPTRWNYNSRLVEMMSEYKQEVLNLMDTIIENGEKWDSETLSCARGFFQTIQDFDFNFFLLIFDFVNHLKNMRNNFDQIWSKSEQYLNTEMPLRSKRLRITEVSEDKKTNYRRLFFEIIDVLVTKINERFSEISKLQFFSLLDFSKFDQFVNQFPTSSMDSLKNSYGEYFDFSILKSELTIVYSSTEFHKRNINELWLYLKSTELSESLPQVTKLSSLILTIPATSAGAERSFSTLKRIHTYLRNSQSQNRLSALSILSIEKQLLTQIQKENSFYDEVIEDYSKKPRRINLCFK
ncbi:uncharacterized protein LOC103308484 [Acyrthosiphon pisum]|uniref:HAT C-terminal dimerisation domain-containing protein n=1 Tax=Acyrthosiphon pisum TaxID=7029 RepID=A0A8R1X1I6_ACYPI|nr:uncharacterized protein LOC103308484 [Acyrthosiphon pisum]|eukprot:XP_008180138.1 PREDICTED: uncharacterized protein LOC103308484 [Acyrthosiphon pisum]